MNPDPSVQQASTLSTAPHGLVITVIIIIVILIAVTVNTNIEWLKLEYLKRIFLKKKEIFSYKMCIGICVLSETRRSETRRGLILTEFFIIFPIKLIVGKYFYFIVGKAFMSSKLPLLQNSAKEEVIFELLNYCSRDLSSFILSSFSLK